MLRRVAASCYQSMNVTAKAALARMTQVSFLSPKYQHPVPAVQFLTIPLRTSCDGLRRGRQVRNFASVAQSEPSTSTYREDYDEWYSHGRVGHVTSEAIDEETDWFKSGNASNALHRGFLLDELKHEAPSLLHEHFSLKASGAADYYAMMELAMAEGEDDFLDDLDFTDDDCQVLERET